MIREDGRAAPRRQVGVAAVLTLALVAGCGDKDEVSRDTARATKRPAAETTVRECGSRGEPSARPRPGELVLGPTRSGLNSYDTSKPSLFASRADQVGFRRFIGGPRGREDRRRDEWLRLAPSHYSQLKTPISVRAGHTVTLSIADADREHAAFMFDLAGHGGRQVGPYYSFRVSDGTPRVRLEACSANEPRFSGPGTVGPYTAFPGAMIVAGARCITLEVHERGRTVRRVQLGFGVPICARGASSR